MAIFLLLLFHFPALGTKKLEYQLARSYGRLKFDFSYNSREGLSANSRTASPNDVISTDRGSYFNAGTTFIQGPVNVERASGFQMISTLTILAWVVLEDDDAEIFTMYTIYSFITVYRLKANSMIESNIKNTLNLVSTTYTLSGPANSFSTGRWILVALSYSSGSVKLSTDGTVYATLSISISTEQQFSIRLGYYNSKALKGMMFYFLIDDSADPNSYMGASSTNCLITGLPCPGSCTPAIVDPYYGTGCVSTSTDVTKSSKGETCNNGSGCSNGVSLICTCSTMSCVVNYSSRSCGCMSYMNDATTTSCNCLSNYIVGASSCSMVCNTQCIACTDPWICSTCKTSNASPHSVIGCACNPKFYNTTALTTSGACLACHNECATCTQANLCNTCITNNAVPNTGSGCKCTDGYYGTGPFTSASLCNPCYSECATCNSATACTTCKAVNASPSGTGCICNTGYIGSPPLNTVNSCSACHQECLSCSTANICTACKATYATPDSVSGCNCNSGYFGNHPLTTASSCSLCHQECSGCTPGNLCAGCKANNANPDAVQGCNCIAGYGGIKPLLTSNACVICHQDCDTCNQINVCLACKSLNASPDAVQGCKCNTGYGAVASLSDSNACIQCNQECSSCNQLNICISCKASNASPDTTIGCKCNPGYGGVAPLITSGACVLCHQECNTCNQLNICLSCKALNSSPDSSQGCKCDTGYGGIAPLITSDACVLCDQECLTCNQVDVCITCKANNALPSIIQGCRCNTGYWGISPLLLSTDCVACYNECLSCDEAHSCTSCRDPNAIPDSSQGCICKTQYFNTSALGTSVSSCISCYSECQECIEPFKCTSCISSNAHIDSTQGCKCDNGYWGTAPLISLTSCSSCHEHCLTCSTALLCTACKTLNAHIALVQGCECNSGFYTDGYLTFANSCMQCHSDCLECVEQNKCIKCKDSLSFPDLTIGCICQPGFYFDSKKVCQPCNSRCLTCNSSDSCLSCTEINTNPKLLCSCNSGYYSSSLVPYKCMLCPKDCKTCYNSTLCTACNTFGANPSVLGTCECPTNSVVDNSVCICSEGYYLKNASNNTSICEHCGLDCKSCLNALECTSCVNPYHNVKNGTCVLDCDASQTLINGICIGCPKLCSSCDENFSCFDCVKNSYLNKTKCFCKSGYEQLGNNCREMTFTATLSVNQDNLARLLFTRIPEMNLTIDDFHVTIYTNSSYSIGFFQKSNEEYYFSLTFSGDITQNTLLIVEILINPLKSIDNYSLTKYNFSSTLNEWNALKENKNLKALGKSIGAASKSSVTVSIGMSIVSNPASTWVMINTIQLIYYLPLNSNPLTPALRLFCISIGGYNILPNYMEYIFESNASSTTYPEAENFGMETSVFWINIGQTVTMFLGILALFPFIKLLSVLNLGKVSNKAKAVLGNYRYSVFLRFWIQSYVDIGILSLVQMKSDVNNPSTGYFNFVTAVIMILSVIITPYWALVITCISYTKITNPSDHTYMQRFGSLYEELTANKRFINALFYPLYFTRRLSFILSQVFLNSKPKVQAGLNISFTLLMIIFIIFFRPFKEKLLFITHLVGEICVLITFSLTAIFLTSLSNSNSRIIESIVISTIMCGMGTQFFIVAYTFYSQIKVSILKLKAYREQRLLQSTQKHIIRDTKVSGNSTQPDN